jgi:hypothetical protein
LHRVSVHSRVGERRNVEAAYYILCQYLTQGIKNGLAFKIEDAKEGQDSLPGLLDAQHRLVVVPVYVFVLFQVLLPTVDT